MGGGADCGVSAGKSKMPSNHSSLASSFGWPQYGPDSVHSWLTAGACALSGFFALAPLRSFGVLFVAIMQEFGANREEASWTLMMLGGARVLSGVLAGPLAHRFTARPVILLGTIISSGGVMLAYFATNMWSLHLTLGMMHVGYLNIFKTSVPLARISSEHFIKYQAFATGVCFAGSTLGSFVFPKLLELLIDQYGFQESMLLFGVLILNAAAFSLFLRQPRWLRRCSSSEEALFSQANSEENGLPPCPYVIPTGKDKGSTEKQPGAALGPCPYLPEPKKNTTFLQSGIEVFKIPKFYLVIYSFVAFNLSYDCYSSLLVDFAVDKGIPQSKAVTMTSLSSLADLVGRLGLPIVADRQLIRRRTLMAMVLALLGALYVVLPWCIDYWTLFALSSAVAFLLGSGVVLFPVVLIDCVGMDRIAMATGMLTAVSSSFSFAKPPLIGFFRDTLGAYDLLFIACGSVAVSTSLAWMVVNLAKRKRHNKWTLDSVLRNTEDGIAALYYTRPISIGDGQFVERRSRRSSVLTVLY
ncbi:hypothetical protein HPB48_019257 [Haemaphysalis longicornis]|uniref:Monocarboxylate transporter n=1 Tax=Haemaphysalis longicornis TaxID=44386 RepID=A0A9J6GGR7_HAELO|nr:hypothetical protein HPB48_019257 [Haemaphysalis longicornis]